jgi:hypothetical protein
MYESFKESSSRKILLLSRAIAAWVVRSSMSHYLFQCCQALIESSQPHVSLANGSDFWANAARPGKRLASQLVEGIRRELQAERRAATEKGFMRISTKRFLMESNPSAQNSSAWVRPPPKNPLAA